MPMGPARQCSGRILKLFLIRNKINQTWEDSRGLNLNGAQPLNFSINNRFYRSEPISIKCKYLKWTETKA